jgi:hypothetical protein
MAGETVGANINAADILDASTEMKALLQASVIDPALIDTTGAEAGDVLTVVDGVAVWQAPA